MSAALTPPLIVASALLCVAGTLKLRSPHVAAGALAALGLPASAWLVRALATGELALGALCALHPSRPAAGVLAGAYAAFAVAAWLLARRRTACGCFGEDETPASALHSAASAILAGLALAAAATSPPQGLGWLLHRSAATAVVALVGTAGALYAVVLVYMLVPRAWGAWESE